MKKYKKQKVSASDFVGLEEGKTILLVSHNSEDIKVLCDTIHEMDHGEIHVWEPQA